MKKIINIYNNDYFKIFYPVSLVLFLLIFTILCMFGFVNPHIILFVILSLFTVFSLIPFKRFYLILTGYLVMDFIYFWGIMYNAGLWQVMNNYVMFFLYYSILTLVVLYTIFMLKKDTR